MELILLTDRLRLRPTDESDLDVSLEMFTDPDVVKYVCDLMTESEIRNEMPNWNRRGGNGCIGIWCISDRDSGEEYGTVFLLPMPIDEDETDFSLVVPDRMPEAEIEIGFELKRSAWGKGYATEACKRLLQFAFEETPLNEVVATFYEENVAARHVLEKSGLFDRGRMWCYGDDCPNYRITRNEWMESQENI